MRVPFRGNLIDRSKLKPVYSRPYHIFNEKHGYSPRLDVEARLSNRWDELDPHTPEEYLEFYRDETLVSEELALWYARQNNRRMSRSLVAGSIARDFGCKTFAEFGCGLGADALALALQGFEPTWIGDVNLKNFELIKALWSEFDKIPPLHDLYNEKPADLPGADFLFSSDVLEHLKNPELIADWIVKYDLVIAYAPFGKRDGQHQHTTYPANKFHKFMEKLGYQKIVYQLAVPPFVYKK